ncbi:MAG: ABC transporter transmembrane domain-containing protein [Syntrophomonas sp.]
MYHTFQKIIAFSEKHRHLLIKSMLISFLGAIFSALQLMALMIVLDHVLADKRDMSAAWISLGIMILSIAGIAVTSYFSIIKQTETGYYMVAEKRLRIGDRLRYIPMGYFNENSLGNITAVVTTSLGDVENSASRCLVMILGGIFNTLGLTLALLLADCRVGLVVLAGLLLYLLVTELSQKHASSGTLELALFPFYQHDCLNVRRDGKRDIFTFIYDTVDYCFSYSQCVKVYKRSKINCCRFNH